MWRATFRGSVCTWEGIGADHAKQVSDVGAFLVEADDIKPWVGQDVAAITKRLQDKRGSQRAFLSQDARRGKQFIFVDCWGPYDYSGVRVFPDRVVGGQEAVFQVLGPAGKFAVANVRGDVKVEPPAGSLPAKVVVSAEGPGLVEFEVDLRTRGKTLKAVGVLLSAEWEVRHFGWSKDLDPREGPDNWNKIISKRPLAETTSSGVDYHWGNSSPGEGVPADYFATVASGSIDLPAGKYGVVTVSDDGVRVLIDGKEVLSNWTWHGPTRDEVVVELEAGQHAVRIEHFEIDGYAQLEFTLEPTK